jgi:hypothetical protein
MNQWNELLRMLDKVFGLPNRVSSTFKKRTQWFDEQTNEHVFLIEYRTKVANQMVSTRPVVHPTVKKVGAKPNGRFATMMAAKQARPSPVGQSVGTKTKSG